MFNKYVKLLNQNTDTFHTRAVKIVHGNCTKLYSTFVNYTYMCRIVEIATKKRNLMLQGVSRNDLVYERLIAMLFPVFHKCHLEFA